MGDGPDQGRDDDKGRNSQTERGTQYRPGVALSNLKGQERERDRREPGPREGNDLGGEKIAEGRIAQRGQHGRRLYR